jgi:hypothetical protein
MSEYQHLIDQYLANGGVITYPPKLRRRKWNTHTVYGSRRSYAKRIKRG